MKLLSLADFSKRHKKKNLSEAELNRRWVQHARTHAALVIRGNGGATISQKGKRRAKAKRGKGTQKHSQVHAVLRAAARSGVPFAAPMKRNGKQKKQGVDGIPGAPRTPAQIVHAMFPRITWPKFESTSAGQFKMHPGRTLSGRQTQIIFMSWKLDRISTTAASSSTAYYEIKPALFNGTAGGALNPVPVTKFTAFAGIWQQVRLLGLRFYFIGLQGRNTPGKIVTWLDYRVNSSSAPALATLELRDTKTEILADSRIAHVTWGREDLEDARFINAVTTNSWRPNDANTTPNYDVLYLATDPSCPTSTALFDVYVHAFTEWTETIV